MHRGRTFANKEIIVCVQSIKLFWKIHNWLKLIRSFYVLATTSYPLYPPGEGKEKEKVDHNLYERNCMLLINRHD